MNLQITEVIVSIAGFLVVFYFKQFNDSIKEVVVNIKKLNEKMGIIVERTESHSYEIELLRTKNESLVADVAILKSRMKD